ncbi:helix-turn-helix transcriptional regulator [uncultured Thiodictyon sp.]|jgi:transcriptional regulator with XRE-family HTH domain|uniref:helix-turn-helix domain-containing protein n=1 Tax=uncultured Thiodictyon sp. TaxID=1846217 RepID=UPI0025EB87D8|nr:helix-turn-helix transcriptional regulator [uncultured Thiodictyon sp.]
MSDTAVTIDPIADLTQRIGNRLREARHDQQLSLSELAERTGCYSKSRISNYEQGLRRMGLEESMVLAAALGTVSPTWLLCLDDNPALDQDEVALIARYRATDDDSRVRLRELAQTLPAVKSKRAKKP